MELKTQISILGCGWLGLPLAEHLIQLNFKIKGSTTRHEKLKTLQEKEIIPYQIQLTETQILGDITAFLNGSSILIINIPPGLRKRPNKNHVKEIQLLLNHVQESEIKHVLFISSTSVFADQASIPTIINSSTPDALQESSKQLIAVEQLLKELSSSTVSILRFGGLFDASRHPAKILAGKSNVSNPDAPINLIHKSDCIGLITMIIEGDAWEHTFNAAYPYHPLKNDYYYSYCIKHHLEPPKFNREKSSVGKIISSKKTEQFLSYQLEHQP